MSAKAGQHHQAEDHGVAQNKMTSDSLVCAYSETNFWYLLLQQMAEAALADEWVMNGDRVALQRRVLRLGKPPRRWKRPPWAALAMREPLEV